MMMNHNHNIIIIILNSLCCPLLIHSYIILFSLITTTTVGFIDPHYVTCEPKTCGNNQTISYPFYILGRQEPFCGYPGFGITCSRDGYPVLNLSNTPYIIDQIFYENASLRASNAVLSRWGTNSTGCLSLTQNLTLPPTNEFVLDQSQQKDIMLFFNCDLSLLPRGMEQHSIGCFAGNTNNSVMAMYKEDKDVELVSKRCRGEVVDAVVVEDGNNGGGGVEEALRRGVLLNWTASDCNLCRSTEGRCGFNLTIHTFRCYCTDRVHASNCTEKQGMRWRVKVGLGLGIGILSILLICLAMLFLIYKRKHASSGGDFRSRNSFSESSLNPHLESDGVYLGVTLFSYKDLKEATNNFDHTKELGDGGFGTVYFGKLQDGREVAVKRLYEHNYRRVEQFINEVQILTRLRHKNLVSLYGCTSRHSRELLLVYEYIPNGTVASHVHGESAKPGSPPWPTRFKIAIETANALAYLHACDIIHRDVKTNNILLDNNFTVKVADFGLSRPFPIDATHVSTAPQGTPGYVDPEYYQNYQLTSKSDVYSFGVVLIELISSKPAVDMNRDKDEINLSNLAIKKIQERAISELVDPSLGFDSDDEVKRMIVSVTELAFQCLQRDKELRPSMDEVLEELKKIESGNGGIDLQEEVDVHSSADVSHSNSVRPPPPPPSPDQWDEVGLLKNIKFPTSPNNVTDKWESKCTTPNASA